MSPGSSIGINVDIVIVRDGKVLLGLASKKWLHEGRQVYGLPGQDIRFGETFGQAVRRHAMGDIGCTVKSYEIFSVNANYALGNHYIGIGALTEIDGEPKVMRPDDWESIEWFALDALPDNLFPPAKIALESYLQKKICVSE